MEGLSKPSGGCLSGSIRERVIRKALDEQGCSGEQRCNYEPTDESNHKEAQLPTSTNAHESDNNSMQNTSDPPAFGEATAEPLSFTEMYDCGIALSGFTPRFAAEPWSFGYVRI
ncbi:unnamed protein product [Phytophthora fragariaefolia]|uniref:Unnamed protein product n=1 Tax=Phytophthora fragariaefolia TaxID=1490495 RepID=A0A9W6XZQ2_9STRA|nr:unnamed protein product [Phytophthora fragariaefolia]